MTLEELRHHQNRYHHLRRMGLSHGEAMAQLQSKPDISSLTGSGLDPNLEYYDDLFFYFASGGNLAPGGVTNTTFNIMSDSSFEWMRSSYYANKHGAGTPIASNSLIPVNVFITDTGSGRQLMLGPVPIQTIAGQGGLPFINPASRVFKPSATVQVAFTNFDAADTIDNITFVFIGRKIFQGGPPIAG